MRRLAEDPAKKVVVITNTPYELNIPAEAGTVVVSFASSPPNMEVVAGALFGQAQGRRGVAGGVPVTGVKALDKSTIK